MQPLSFFSSPGGQSFGPCALARAALVPLAADLAVPAVPPLPMLMFVVLLFVALLPAVLPLPLMAPLVLPAVVPAPLAEVVGAVAVLPDLRVLAPARGADAVPRLVVAVREPLVLAAAPAWLLSVPVEDEVWAIEPAAHKAAISAARSLLMVVPFEVATNGLILLAAARNSCRRALMRRVGGIPMAGSSRARPRYAWPTPCCIVAAVHHLGTFVLYTSVQ
jgi:hypothetical protein